MASTVAMFVAIIIMARVATAPRMVLLYSGLDPASAGEVVESLEQKRVSFRVTDDAILVDAAQRDRLRMTLAREGLPTATSGGYELLDKLPGFGTTAQMFDAAYWRAKEGELARTIVSSPNIAKARVHISNTSDDPFARPTDPKASVTLMSDGRDIDPKQAEALRFLVASAVAGLSASDVSIIDSEAGLIAASDQVSINASSSQTDDLRARIQRLLEARVGVGNAVVELSLEKVTESESIIERILDPEGRVVVRSDTEENVNNSQNQSGGAVTVASNIPDGDAANTEGSNSQNSTTRERLSFEVSETQREIIRTPGAVKRITVAVLVNGVPQETSDGVVELVPRAQDELDALHALVASAIGFDQERGDVITLRSMGFEPLTPKGTLASASLFSMNSFDLVQLLKLIIAAATLIGFGMFVVRPLLRNSAVPAISDLNETPDASTLPAPAIGSPNALLNDERDVLNPAEIEAQGEVMDPVERLRSLIKERQSETVEVLRGWLEAEHSR